MPAGRPSKYSKSILTKARRYLNGGYEGEDELFPTVAGLSLYLNITRSTVHDWATHEDKKEFSDITQAILAKQERSLMRNGASGDYNPTITKLLLSKHGYADKVESTNDNTHTFNGVSDEELEEIIKGAAQ
ncbi:MAG: terminase small subunit [Opitutales bacterium]